MIPLRKRKLKKTVNLSKIKTLKKLFLNSKNKKNIKNTKKIKYLYLSVIPFQTFKESKTSCFNDLYLTYLFWQFFSIYLKSTDKNHLHFFTKNGTDRIIHSNFLVPK